MDLSPQPRPEAATAAFIAKLRALVGPNQGEKGANAWFRFGDSETLLEIRSPVSASPTWRVQVAGPEGKTFLSINDQGEIRCLGAPLAPITEEIPSAVHRAIDAGNKAPLTYPAFLMKLVAMDKTGAVAASVKSLVAEAQSASESGATFSDKVLSQTLLHKLAAALESSKVATIISKDGKTTVAAVRVSKAPFAMQILGFGDNIDTAGVLLVTSSEEQFSLSRPNAEGVLAKLQRSIGRAAPIAFSERSKTALGIQATLRRGMNLEASLEDPEASANAKLEIGEYVAATSSGITPPELARALQESPALAPTHEMKAELEDLLSAPLMATPGETSHRESENLLVTLSIVAEKADKKGTEKLRLVIDAKVKLGDRTAWLDLNAILVDVYESGANAATILTNSTDELGQLESDPLVPGKKYSARVLAF
jgi:hypothetical protein